MPDLMLPATWRSGRAVNAIQSENLRAIEVEVGVLADESDMKFQRAMNPGIC
jgi:hypothetical protein